jgi:hypothetical protein
VVRTEMMGFLSFSVILQEQLRHKEWDLVHRGKDCQRLICWLLSQVLWLQRLSFLL